MKVASLLQGILHWLWIFAVWRYMSAGRRRQLTNHFEDFEKVLCILLTSVNWSLWWKPSANSLPSVHSNSKMSLPHVHLSFTLFHHLKSLSISKYISIFRIHICLFIYLVCVCGLCMYTATAYVEVTVHLIGCPSTSMQILRVKHKSSGLEARAFNQQFHFCAPLPCS